MEFIIEEQAMSTDSIYYYLSKDKTEIWKTFRFNKGDFFAKVRRIEETEELLAKAAVLGMLTTDTEKLTDSIFVYKPEKGEYEFYSITLF